MTNPTSVPVLPLPDSVRSYLAARAEGDVARALADEVWIAHHRIEGNFPGGVADLAYRFEVSGGLIARLDITA